MGKLLKHRGWNLLDTGYLPRESLLKLFDLILSGEYIKGESLKKHHRSTVYRFRYAEHELIHKVPLEKNKRLWIRLTTLFREGEAFRNIRGMELLTSLGIPTNIPVMAAEKRTAGMVTNSFLIYEFLDGVPCTGKEATFPLVTERLAEMHTKGVLHGDSQIQNFILTNDHTVKVIDSNPKPVKGPQQIAEEYAYLQRSSPGIERYFGAIAASPMYQRAANKLAFERRMAKAKRRFKRLLGFRVKEG